LLVFDRPCSHVLELKKVGEQSKDHNSIYNLRPDSENKTPKKFEKIRVTLLN